MATASAIGAIELSDPITRLSKKPAARVAELDAIRGYAALAVLVYHLFSYYLPFGWAAVDLFFVLSGFLITTIVLNGKERPGFLKQFYIRRGSRIFPIYYIAILAVVLMNPLLPSPYELGQSLPWYLTYTQNMWCYAGADGPFLPILRHTWTLAIEEQFYLLWPLLLWWGGRSSVLPLCFVLIGTSAIARTLGFHEHLLLTKCDGFAFGAIGSVIVGAASSACWVQRAAAGFVVILVVGAGALLGGAAWFGLHEFSGDENSVVLGNAVVWMPVIYAACLGLVGVSALGQGHWLLSPLRIPAICYIGQISYGLYLYHYIVISVIGQTPLAAMLGFVPTRLLIGAASVAIAAASWRLVEQPILRWKDRFEPQVAVA